METGIGEWGWYTRNRKRVTIKFSHLNGWEEGTGDLNKWAYHMTYHLTHHMTTPPLRISTHMFPILFKPKPEIYQGLKRCITAKYCNFHFNVLLLPDTMFTPEGTNRNRSFMIGLRVLPMLWIHSPGRCDEYQINLSITEQLKSDF